MPNYQRVSLAPAARRVLRVEAGPDRIIITTSPISSDAPCAPPLIPAEGPFIQTVPANFGGQLALL